MQLCNSAGVGCGLADHPAASESETDITHSESRPFRRCTGWSLGLALFPTCDLSDLEGEKDWESMDRKPGLKLVDLIQGWIFRAEVGGLEAIGELSQERTHENGSTRSSSVII